MSVSLKTDRAVFGPRSSRKLVALCALTLAIGLGGAAIGSPALASGAPVSARTAVNASGEIHAPQTAKTPTVSESTSFNPVGFGGQSPDVTFGKSLTIAGVGTPADILELQQKFLGKPGYEYVAVASNIVVSSAGYYSVIVNPNPGQNAKYRVRGSNGLWSSEITVKVASSTSFSFKKVGKANGLTTRYIASGTVAPAVKGQVIKVTVTDRDNSVEIVRHRKVRTDKNGNWSYSSKYAYSTDYDVKVTPQKTDLNAEGQSVTKYKGASS